MFPLENNPTFLHPDSVNYRLDRLCYSLIRVLVSLIGIIKFDRIPNGEVVLVAVAMTVVVDIVDVDVDS